MCIDIRLIGGYGDLKSLSTYTHTASKRFEKFFLIKMKFWQLKDDIDELIVNQVLLLVAELMNHINMTFLLVIVEP